MSQVNVSRLPLWKKILFTTIPIGLFLILMEAGVRLSGPMQDVRVMCFHPLLQRAYCPGVTGAIKYDAVLTINQDGLIDRDYPVQRVPGALRIAVLGDSFTAGEEVGMGKRFHELWEERLPRKLGNPVEILNFGVRGYGTWHELQMFHLRAAKYKPDWVVVNFLWMNDVNDNLNRWKESDHNPLNDDYPEESWWDTLMVKRKNFNKWLWNHSAAYQFFRTRYNRFENWLKRQFRADYQEHEQRMKEFQKEDNLSEKKSSPAIKLEAQPGRLQVNTDSPLDDLFFADSEGWDITRKLFLKLKQEVEANGGKLAVIHFPSENQMHDYPAMPREEFNAFLETNGIAHMDLYGRYQTLSREELLKTTYVKEHGDHHFSEWGHRLYADWTEAFLARLASRN